MGLIVEAVGNENAEAMCALVDNDQLTPCLATAATFPGFQELTLPSFRYKSAIVSCSRTRRGIPRSTRTCRW